MMGHFREGAVAGVRVGEAPQVALVGANEVLERTQVALAGASERARVGVLHLVPLGPAGQGQA